MNVLSVINWQDVYRRYEAGVWAVPLALLPSFFLTALFGQPSCLGPLIDLVIAHTPLSLAHLVLNVSGPLARPLALVGAIALSMPLIGLLSILAPPIVTPHGSFFPQLLRWLSVTVLIFGSGFYLASLATNSISALASVLAGVTFLPMLLWTRTWRRVLPFSPGRRKVTHSLLGTPLITALLALLASYEGWSNLSVRLLGLGNPVRRLFPFLPPSARQPGFPVPGTEPEVTPINQFYINGKNVTDPLMLAQDWELRMSGLVRTPLTLTYEQLIAMPRTSYYATMRCVDNPVDGHLISTAYWSGVRVSELLALAQPLPQATTLVFRAADQFAEPFALAEPSLDAALLAYAMNGETLMQQHGAPVRVLLPGWYGFRNVKWLQEIVLTADAVDGYWEHNGWQAEQIHTVARIDVVHLLDTHHILATGVAFGGLRGLSNVQLRVNDGPWRDAQLNIPALSVYTWVQWRAVIEVAQTQFHLTARMIDASGVPQDAHVQGTYPSGSSGLHTMQVQLF